jgi:hypothetical protein
MTEQSSEKPSRLALLASAAPDLVGVLGLCLLTRGLWAGWGEAVALSICGAVLLSLALVSVVRGGR